MTSKRLFFVLLAVLTLLGIGSVAAVVVGNSQLKKRSQQLHDLKVESGALEEQQKSLIQAKKDIDRYSGLDSIAKSIVPQEKDQARTVRELVQLASNNSIKIGSITFPASTLGQAAPKPVAGTEGAAPAGPSAASAQTQLKAVEGIPGVYQMEINLQSDSSTPVTYQQLIDFLRSLEQSRRTSQVSSVIVTPDTKQRNRVTFSLVINVNIKP